MIELLLILISLGLVFACGLFVASEFSLVTVDRPTVERRAEEGDAAADGVLDALRSLSTQLSAAQVGITLTNLLIGFLAEPAIADLVHGPLEDVGVTGDAADATSLVIALVLATGVTMVFGELVPKNLAIARPLETARAVQRFQRTFTVVAGPVIRLCNDNANRLLHRLGVEPQEELASARSPEELASLARRSAEQGTLGDTTAELLTRSIAFGEHRAIDVMTPRVKVHVVGADSPAIEVFRLARATGRSRFPVVEGDRGDVCGIVHVKHVMAVPHEDREDVTVRSIMVDPVLVPSTIELDPLLTLLREGGLQLAVVVDEWGNVDGIVTLEDLIEEIVGDVRDEHDGREETVRHHPAGGWTISALLREDEIEEEIGIAIPDDPEVETVGGLIALHLGRMPQVGDAIELDGADADGAPQHVTLTVLAMDGLRIDRVRLQAEPAVVAGDDAEPGEGQR